MKRHVMKPCRPTVARLSIIGLALGGLLLGSGPRNAGATPADPLAATFTTLLNFAGTNGGNPYDSLVEGTDGNLYGTTRAGGAHDGGTIFQMTPAGSQTVIYSFCTQSRCSDGTLPNGLALGSDGNFYGTTYGGGAGGLGTVFQMTPAGTLTTLYSFCMSSGCPDGSGPHASLVEGTDGNFYGTTVFGGSTLNTGVAFKITPTGTMTTLYRFCSQAGCADGAYPTAALVLGVNGNFYGTTESGGTQGVFGTAFEISSSGTLTTLYSFCALTSCADGAVPEGPLVQAPNGTFYGVATDYGANGSGGTIFGITSKGNYKVIYSFCGQTNCADGSGPTGGLVRATDGNFYGTTYQGGASTACNSTTILGCGTVFEITPKGTFTTLQSFTGTDGATPYFGLVQGTDGSFYGATYSGGTSNAACYIGCGTVFSLSNGLGPFVEVLPVYGTVGATIQILGSDLTGATAVSFNGTAATFTVTSSTLITATVPTGATPGFITVTTPTGTLKSNTRFLVE